MHESVDYASRFVRVVKHFRARFAQRRSTQARRYAHELLVRFDRRGSSGSFGHHSTPSQNQMRRYVALKKREPWIPGQQKAKGVSDLWCILGYSGSHEQQGAWGKPWPKTNRVVAM
jgi:hypothetical protein